MGILIYELFYCVTIMVIYYFVHCGGDDVDYFALAVLGGLGAAVVGAGGNVLLGFGVA
jgi:hypothetical protein